MSDYANKIRNSIKFVINEGKHVTKDLGGNSKTQDYVKAIIDNIQ